MAISTLEYPVVVPQGTEPPADGPRPYIGNNDDINLAYFREEAPEEEWDRYNGWIREQSETRRPYDAQVVDAHSEQIMTRDVFTTVTPNQKMNLVDVSNPPLKGQGLLRPKGLRWSVV